MTKGTLYIVATPIGNLSDFSRRAVETLKKVDIVACEDTRVTQKLLNHYEISAKTLSYHKFSEKQRSGKIIELLNEGKNVALVSDAGTPLISDPGSVLVSEVINNGIKIVPIPGACAMVSALSASPCNGKFAFLGFFPQKQSDINNLSKYIYDFDLVFYESPNRILKTLEILRENFGEITVSLARELTKIYEDINTLSVSDMIEYLSKTVVKGEITFIVHHLKSKKNDTECVSEAKKLLKEGFSPKDTAKIISIIFNLPKNEVYKRILNI